MAINSFITMMNFLDLFGVHPEWRALSKKTFKTKFSSFLSAILILIIIYKFVNLTVMILGKKSYTQKIIETYNDKNTTLNISQMQIALCLSNGKEFDKFSDYFNVSGFSSYIIENKEIAQNDCKVIEDKYNIFNSTNKTEIEKYMNSCYCLSVNKYGLYQNEFTTKSLKLNINKIKDNEYFNNKQNYFLKFFSSSFYFNYGKDIPFQKYIFVDYINVNFI